MPGQVTLGAPVLGLKRTPFTMAQCLRHRPPRSSFRGRSGAIRSRAAAVGLLPWPSASSLLLASMGYGNDGVW